MLDLSPSHRSRTRGAFVLAALGMLAGLAGPPAARGQEPSFVDVVGHSGFIFLGTVKSPAAPGPNSPKTTAATAGASSAATATVTVDRILEALPPIGNYTGRDVQVRLRSPRQPGDRAIFFTYLQSAGTTLGLVEVGSAPASEEPQMPQRIRAARQELADRALSARLASAQLVVVGVFGEGRPTPEARVHKSEHDPLWWRAPIRVESVEKGSVAGSAGTAGRGEQQVYANYASSDDVVWRNAPKPRPGQEGIFLLQPAREVEEEYRTSGLYLIDPLDALPKSELERVRRLLGAGAVR
jgi:hypothetical protein